MKNVIYKNWKASLVSSLCILSMSVFAGEKINKSLTTKAEGRVLIDVMSGTVTIKTWDKNQIQIVGELSDAAEGYQFEVDDDGEAYFKVKMPNNRWGSWGNDNSNDDGSKLEIFIPINNNLRFEGVNVDVDASDIQGGTQINTVNGDVKANNLTNRIKLETVNGSIKSSDLQGKINLNTVNGEIVDKNSQGELEIEAVNGDIETDTAATQIGISNVNGEMKINAKLIKEMEVGTVNGDIDVSLSLAKDGRFVYSSVGGDAAIYFVGDVSANFNIETHAGGDIKNRLTKDRVKEAKYGPGESIRFKMGAGSADVQIDTVSGDVTISKK